MSEASEIEILLKHCGRSVVGIANKVLMRERISVEEGITLFNEAEFPLLISLAQQLRIVKNGTTGWYNRNIHVEPTNLCVRQCKFCSYYRKEGEEGAWDLSVDEILAQLSEHPGITEVHITGGLHPSKDINWYEDLFSRIRRDFPALHIKALTSEELDYLFRKARVMPAEGMLRLRAAGLGSLPGGGAEIFHPDVRNEICPEKISGSRWLELHETAHGAGIFSNATMLFGHIEKIEHRIDHLHKLRELQDRTGGFNAFIPLKYKSSHNELSSRGETSLLDVIKTFAIARIFLDNFGHIKAYWPMLGKETAALLLSMGADDLDGTIHDSTRIYSMAGSVERQPVMDVQQIEELIRHAGFIPRERGSDYNPV